MIKLIINADDFGLRPLFNKKILELIKKELVTSTSVMVDEIDPSQEEQVKELINLSKDCSVSIGLHINFKSLNFLDEIRRQFDKYVALFESEPSHIDLHKKDYIESGYPFIQTICKEKHIPCKNLRTGESSNKGLITTREASFSGTGKTFGAIERWLGLLQNDVYCINFHPGYFDPNFLQSTSNKEGQREIDATNIQKIGNSLDKYDLKLVSFHDLTPLL